MSRVGKKPIELAKGVAVTVTDGAVQVKGPKGQLTHALPPHVSVRVEAGVVRVGSEDDAERAGSAMQGLARALVRNMVVGVTQGYTKTLELVGVGYRADVQGRDLVLALGMSHPARFPLPDGVNAKVEEKQTRIILEGLDKEVLGQTCARLRALRPPEPYKGKGIRYQGESVRQKAGKTAAKAQAT